MKIEHDLMLREKVATAKLLKRKKDRELQMEELRSLSGTSNQCSSRKKVEAWLDKSEMSSENQSVQS